MGILHEDIFIFVTKSCWIILRMENVFQIKVVENIKTHILCSVTFFQKWYCSWEVKNTVEPEKLHMLIWWCIACWVSRATPAQACACTSTHAHANTRMHARARDRVHTHTQICNTYCFTTAAVVLRTQINITLNVHCLSFSEETVPGAKYLSMSKVSIVLGSLMSGCIASSEGFVTHSISRSCVLFFHECVLLNMVFSVM